MHIYNLDKKQNILELEPETLDDLWVLNLIIKENTLVGSKSTRRFRSNIGDDSEKKTIFVKIEVEKQFLDLVNGVLKITGIIKSGSPLEYIDINAHHSIDIIVGTKIIIEKELMDYEIKLLESAKNNKLLPKIYLLILDDDSTLIANIQHNKYNILGNIKSGKSGKRLESQQYRNKYFLEILNCINNNNYDVVIVAGPGFEKDYFKEFMLNRPNYSKFVFTNISTTGITGINELLKGGAVKNILKDFNIQKDTELVEKLFTVISKDGLAIYGKNEIIKYFDLGAIKELFVADSFLIDNYDLIRNILYKLDNIEYHIISTQTDSGKMLDNIGGIAAYIYFKELN